MERYRDTGSHISQSVRINPKSGNNITEWTERETAIFIAAFLIGFFIGGILGITAEQPEIIEVYQDPDEKSNLYNFVAGDEIQTSTEFNEMHNKSYNGTIIGIDGNLIGFYDTNTGTLKAMDETWLEWS